MENPQNTRFFKLIIVILLAINLATIGFIWLQSRRMGLPEVGEFLCKELQFDEKQKEQFMQLKQAHHSQVMQLKDTNKKNHDQFFQLMGSPTDSTKINSAADSIVALQKKIELATFYHFQAVRNICSPTQQKHFDEIIGEAMKMFAARPGNKR